MTFCWFCCPRPPSGPGRGRPDLEHLRLGLSSFSVPARPWPPAAPQPALAILQPGERPQGAPPGTELNASPAPSAFPPPPASAKPRHPALPEPQVPHARPLVPGRPAGACQGGRVPLLAPGQPPGQHPQGHVGQGEGEWPAWGGGGLEQQLEGWVQASPEAAPWSLRLETGRHPKRGLAGEPGGGAEVGWDGGSQDSMRVLEEMSPPPPWRCLPAPSIPQQRSLALSPPC